MSNYSLTPHYAFYMPTPAADIDLWGDHLNANAVKLDSLLYTSAIGAPFLPLAGGVVSGTTTFPAINIQGGSARYISTFSPSGMRWQLGTDNTAEGNNAGSVYQLAAFTDAGAFNGMLFQATRGSGPTGQGPPYFSQLQPFFIGQSRATTPGGITGNDIETPASDVQPTTTLGNNPLSVTSGSPTVTVTWPGCGAATGAVNGTYDTWVLLSGVAAVGGITPTGWLRTTRIDNDRFTVAWTANATSTATGGGSAVNVRPSFTTQGSKYFHETRSGAGGFSVQYSKLFAANPEFLIPGSVGVAQYQQEWRMVYGPPDAASPGTYGWGMIGTEMDLINRGVDVGYSPNIYGSLSPTVGFWIGAYADIPSFIPGGGTSTNWNTAYSVFSYDGLVGTYTGYSVQQNGLVGAARDPTGHGGVGVVLYGARTGLGGGALTTTSGSGVVTVTVPSHSPLTVQANGGSVYIPTVTTLNGVTVGGASYVMSGMTGTTFQVTGTGTASATGSGGAAQTVFFANLVPYAPLEFRGSFKHGISTAEFRSEDGSIIRTQPGNGIIWDDGSGTASVTGVAVSPGVLGVQLSGRIGFNAAPIAKPTGWGAAAGTATRSTFVTGSVTLPTLAEHVKALIDDLTAYGLIGP